MMTAERTARSRASSSTPWTGSPAEPKDLETPIELAEDHGLMIEGPRSGRLDLTTATGRQQARWMAMQAATESDNTSERVKATLARKMREGKPMGGGRLRIRDGRRGAGPAEVAVIREVARRMLDGEPLQELAAEMNDRAAPRGVVSGPGRTWVGCSVPHRYGGTRRTPRRDVGTMKGEPVLDQDTYDAVQAVLASRRRGADPPAVPADRDPGLLDCEHDDERRVRSTAADGTRPRVYRCPPQRRLWPQPILAEPVEERR